MDLINKIAIVIPFYKIAFFEVTLESLANQSDKRFKVYIGDDASPENPLLLLEKFKGRFDFEYYRFDENLGCRSLTKQWERCISLVNDENWIMVLGDDDVLCKEVVKQWYQNFNLFENKTNVVRFSTLVINDQFEFLSKPYFHPQWENVDDSYFRKLKGYSRNSLSEHIFNKKVYLKYKFNNYPLAWHSDDAAWFDFAENKPIFSINSEQIFIRISDKSISGDQNNLREKSEATFKFFYYLLNKKKALNSPLHRDEIFYRMTKYYINNKIRIGCFFKISFYCFKNNNYYQYYSFLQSVIDSFKISLKNRIK